jgi:hypothetical protein
MKINRLRWLGHIEKMDDNRRIEYVYTKKLEWKRPRVRSRQRWKNCVENDLKELRIIHWEEMTETKQNGGKHYLQ